MDGHNKMPEKQYNQLNEILKLKLGPIPDSDDTRLSAGVDLNLDTILKGNKLNWPYCDNNSFCRVAPGATFAGILGMRNEVEENIRNRVPFKDWDVNVLLSMFCSHQDKFHSFSTFFGQTRHRLQHNLLASIEGRKIAPVQAAFTLASMEYMQHPNVFKPSNPTQHMLAFAKLLRVSQEAWKINVQKQEKDGLSDTKGKLFQIRKNLDIWNRYPEDIRENYNFIFGENEPEEVHKRKRTRGKGKGKIYIGGNISAVGGAAAGLIYYDHDTIMEFANPSNKYLLQALIKPMRGMVASGSVPSGPKDAFNMDEFKAVLENPMHGVVGDETRKSSATDDYFFVDLSGMSAEELIRIRDAIARDDIDDTEMNLPQDMEDMGHEPMEM